MRHYRNDFIMLIITTAVIGSPLQAEETLPDPMRPLSLSQGAAAEEMPVATTDWRLQMIRALNGRYVARVNGMTVTEGDTIAGVVVDRITAQSVEMNQDGTVFTLSLAPASFKTPLKQN